MKDNKNSLEIIKEKVEKMPDSSVKGKILQDIENKTKNKIVTK